MFIGRGSFPKGFMGRLVKVLIRKEGRDRLIQPGG
jgi:uncharacterized protein (DUF3820 family)